MRIAIVGTASTSRMEAPFSNDSWQIWTLGQGYTFAPRVDVHFELHRRDVLDAAGVGAGYYKHLAELPESKRMLGYSHPEIPTAEHDLFPWDDVRDHIYGASQGDENSRSYFTSSIAWMFAYAMAHQPQEIGLWGVDMRCSDEWGYQRHCMEYLIGLARGAGIKVTIAKESPLCRASRMYALQDVGIARELSERRVELKRTIAEQEQIANQMQFNKGAMAMLESLEGSWG